MLDFDFGEMLLAISVAFCALSIALYAATTKTANGDSSEASPNAGDDRSIAFSVFRLTAFAFFVRVALSVVVDAFSLDDFFAPDHYGYEQAGGLIARAWHEGRAIPSAAYALANGSPRPFHYLNAVCFYLFGSGGHWAVRLLNCAAGAFAVPLTFEIGRRLYSDRAARLAAVFVAFFPSTILWSSIDIRDAWAVVAILWSALAAIRLRETISLRALVSLSGAILLLGAVRGYMFLIVAAAILLSYLLSATRRPIRSFAAAIVASAALLYIYSRFGFGQSMLDGASLQSLNSQRDALATGDSAFLPHVDISTPAKAFAFLPVGITFFLFAPFPWMIAGARQALTFPEMLVWWYLSLRYLVPGIRRSLSSSRDAALTLISMAALVICSYGLVEGNVGIAYRHRAQVLPILLLFAAVGRVAGMSRGAEAGTGDAPASASVPSATAESA